MHKNQEIEYLRGIAILFTLFHHVAYNLVIHPNSFFNAIYANYTFWGGVDLFFAISGFVIMKSFLRQMEKKEISFWKSCQKFWVKRIFRILPAAWFWLCIYLILTYFFNNLGAFGNFTQNLQDAKVAVLQYANIYGMSCWGENANVQCGPNGIYWSLSLEEQFYVLLPLFVWIFREYLKYFLIIATFGVLFLNRPEWSIGWAIRTDAIMLGVLLAIFSRSQKMQQIKNIALFQNKIVMSFALFLSLWGMAFIPSEYNYVPFRTGLLALICAGLVFIASLEQDSIFNGKLIKKVLLWLGSRSYSLYLIHVIVYRLSYEIFYQLTPVGYKFQTTDIMILLAISIPILLVLSELSYRYIEVPTRALGVKLAS